MSVYIVEMQELVLDKICKQTEGVANLAVL